MVSDRTLQSVFGMRPRAVALWGGAIRGFSTLVVCIVAAALTGVYADVLRTTATVRDHQDFGVFYEAARGARLELAVGGRDRDAADPPPSPNLNPPHFSVLINPLTSLDRATAFVVWLVVSVLGLMGSLFVVARTLALGNWATFALCMIAFASAPMIATLVTGQVALILLLPFTLAWKYARRNEAVASGAWIGVCASIKPFFLLFTLYFAIRGQVGAAVASMVVVTAVFGVGVSVYGHEAYLSWIADLSSVTWAEHYLNASVLGFVERTLSESEWPQVPIVELLQLVGPLWGVMCIGVVVSGLTRVRVGYARDEQFLLMSVTALLLSPLGWVYYAWFLVGPAATVISSPGALVGWRKLVGGLGMAGFLVPLFVPSTAIHWRYGVGTITLGSVYFWSLLALWTVVPRRSEATRDEAGHADPAGVDDLRCR